MGEQTQKKREGQKHCVVSNDPTIHQLIMLFRLGTALPFVDSQLHQSARLTGMPCKLPSSLGWAWWRAQQIHLRVLSPWPSGVEQWKGHRTSRRWRHEGRDALMATKIRFLIGYTVKVSRSSASYFWYFPNNVVLTITFALNFLPIVCVCFSKLRCCSTSAVIFPLNCGSTPKNVCKNGLVGNHCSV